MSCPTSNYSEYCHFLHYDQVNLTSWRQVPVALGYNNSIFQKNQVKLLKTVHRLHIHQPAESHKKPTRHFRWIAGSDPLNDSPFGTVEKTWVNSLWALSVSTKKTTWNGKQYIISAPTSRPGPWKKIWKSPSSVAACTGNTPKSLGSIQHLPVSMTTNLVSSIAGTGQRLRHDSNRMHPNARYAMPLNGMFLKWRFWSIQFPSPFWTWFYFWMFFLHSSHRFNSDDLNFEFFKVFG